MMTTESISPVAPGTAGPRPADGSWFLDTWMHIPCSAKDTDGALSIIEWRGGQGFSPPLHLHHDEDTAMMVLDGQLTVRVGDDERIYGAGETVWMPREVAHSFRVDSETAHYIEMLTPAGFEAFHVEDSRPVTTGRYLPPPQPVDVPALVAHAAQYNCDIIGPPMHAS